MMDRARFARLGEWLRRAAVLAPALALIAPGLAAGEARIGVKGDTLRGRIADLTPEGVSFEPIHGEGSLQVRWVDVESLESDGAFAVLHGDDGEAHGRVLGFTSGKWLLIGDTPENAERVDVATLFHAEGDDAFGSSLLDRLRNRYRYWTASLDAGAAYTDSTTDKVLGFTGFQIDRKKAPTRFLLEAAARYASEDEQDESRTITESMALGFARGELDVTERFFSYASMRATYDGEQHLSLRLEPRGGAGVHIVKSKTRNLSADVGTVWIYEDYFGDAPIDGAFPLERSRGTDNYWTIAFGAQAGVELPYGASWRARVEYLPAVDDWARKYLARAETSIDFPLLEWLAFKVAVADLYDSTPAEDDQRNSFNTTAALSFRFR
jgi:hypothetical protein